MFFEKDVDGITWSVVYDRAVRNDGTLLFKERLNEEYLKGQRKLQGSYIYAHQYL